MLSVCALLLWKDDLSGMGPAPILDELGAVKLGNCGVNVTLFLLGWFDSLIELGQLEDDLGMDVHWSEPTSLAQIKRTLQNRGLKVDAYRDARLDEVLRHLDAGRICLLHVQGDDHPSGHFYLLVARSPTSVLLVDAGSWHKWVPIEQFKEKFGKSFTGFCLLVSKADANPRQRHTLDESIRKTSHAVQEPMVDRVTWFPQKIDYGLVSDSVTLQKPEGITI